MRMHIRPFGHEDPKALTILTRSATIWRMPIQSFRCRDTQALFGGDRIGRFAKIESVAMRKLAMLNRVQVLGDLRVPPGNRLEALYGNRAGQHSIRVNDQYRICFVWTAQGPKDVEIADYH